MDVSERRSRLGTRHLLSSTGSSAVDVVNAMTALHSSDPATVFLSVWSRLDDFSVADLEYALYQERSLLRIYGMRRTLWVIPRGDIDVIVASSTNEIARRERRRTTRFLEEGGVADDGEAWLTEVGPTLLSYIRDQGEVLTREISSTLPDLSGKIVFRNRSGAPIGTTGVASRVILQMSMESRLVRTRPAGTWISGQYRWADIESWLEHPIPEMTREDASARLLMKLLHTFGPATEADLRWWTGWRVAQIRQALTDANVAEVDLGGATGYVRGDDVEPIAKPPPWVALLPSLDPTAMGWKERNWYLGEHGGRLFDRNGNAGPTVWVEGRVVGGWAQRNDGEVVYELFEDIGDEATSALDARAAELQSWMGEVVVTPRFRSPHDKSLTD